MKLRKLVAALGLVSISYAASAGGFAQLMDDAVTGQTTEKFNTRAIKHGDLGLDGTGLDGATLPTGANGLGNQGFAISALIDFDAAISNRGPDSQNSTRFGFGSGDTAHWNSAFSVTNAAIFIDSPVTEWLSAHISLRPDFVRGNVLTAGYEHIDSTGTLAATVGNAAEGYLTVNPEGSMFYGRLGVQHVPFGNNRYGANQEGYYPILTSPVDALTNTGPIPAATVGVASEGGFHASVTAIHGAKSSNQSEVSTLNNFSTRLGYVGTMNSMGSSSVDMSVSYINNVNDVVLVGGAPGFLGGTYTSGSRNGAVSAHAAGMFDVGNDMFLDLSVDGVFYTDVNATGSRTYAIGVDGGLTFEQFGTTHRAALGYHITNNAAALIGALPHHRIQGEWTTELDENYADLGAVFYYDVDYKTATGGTGRELVGAIARLSARIA